MDEVVNLVKQQKIKQLHALHSTNRSVAMVVRTEVSSCLLNGKLSRLKRPAAIHCKYLLSEFHLCVLVGAISSFCLQHVININCEVLYLL